MVRTPRTEIRISVDVEASGPSPSVGSLLSIGACLVDDLDVAFYRELRTGTPKDEALRRAQASLLRGRHRHPFHWAAFQLHGDWR